jgi:hypothetical protein
MKYLLTATMTFFGFAGAAHACPDYTQWGTQTFNMTGDELYTLHDFEIIAGGDNYLPGCGFAGNETGYFTTAPDFSFNLSNMDPYRIVISVLSKCDAALLVNTSSSKWSYDDDSNGNSDPRLDIEKPGNGVLDVWVGTYDGEYCDAVLSVETF